MKTDLFDAAKAARENSYSPYSQCRVGAAVRTVGGQVYAGCNVENASYGATVCAERVAIQKAVSEGHVKIREVMVVTDATPPWAPCGMCRQVIAEFGEDVQVHMANLKGEAKTVSFRDLFPNAMTPEQVFKKS